MFKLNSIRRYHQNQEAAWIHDKKILLNPYNFTHLIIFHFLGHVYTITKTQKTSNITQENNMMIEME